MHISRDDPGYVIIKLNLVFNREELAVLSNCARCHYDTKCVAADKNGIINAIRNSFADDTSDQTNGVAVDSQDIGLLLKILEVSKKMQPLAGASFLGVATSLSLHLKETLKIMAEFTHRYNQHMNDAGQMVKRGD